MTEAAFAIPVQEIVDRFYSGRHLLNTTETEFLERCIFQAELEPNAEILWADIPPTLQRYFH